MKLFICTDHEGFWPVGVASIVIAESEEQARHLLFSALRSTGLKKDEPFTLTEVDLNTEEAYVLHSGNY